MRYLLIALPFLIGAGWMTPDDIASCNNDESYKVWVKEQPDSYEVNGKNCRYHTLQVVQEDDLDNPIYGNKSNVVVCPTEAVCAMLLPNLCQSPAEAFWGPVDDHLEAWCAEVVGFEQKDVTKLLLDVVLKVAYDAEVDASDLKAQNKADAAQNIKDNWQTLPMVDKIDEMAKALGLIE